MSKTAIKASTDATAERQRIHALWQTKLSADPWSGWRALLQGLDIEGVKVPVDPNTPFTGYYRSKRQDKTFAPVAYWIDNKTKEWVCLVDGRQIDTERAIANWPFVSRYPISHAWYKAVAEEGKPWPDADERLTSQALSAAPYADESNPREVIGGNNPPEETPVVMMRNKIDAAKGGLKDYVKINDEETLAKAKSLKNRLTELSGEAKKEREKLSRPHLDALDEIRSEWSPLVDEPAADAKTINNEMDAYATRKLQAQRAEEARVKAEQDAADKIKRDNEEKLRLAEATGKAAKLEIVPEVKPAAAPPADTTVRPGYGRSATPKAYFEATEITSADELFKFLITPKIHPELKTLMLTLAQRAKDAGFEPPGVKFEEKAKIRG